MKLIGCYIENFGKLHQFSQTFEPGLTVLAEGNGFGKTTLATFLRCMFYGMPRGKKSDLTRDLRRKYTPWQGGTYGGTLEFEAEGRRYRVERTFGDKPSQDTFALYELPGLHPSNGYTRELGVELFGLDGDSFQRSSYLPQLREPGGLSTDSIQAKLGDLVEETGDMGGYEAAVAALKKERSAWIPYRGTGGRVAESAALVSRLETQVDHCQRDREALAHQEAILSQTEEALQAAEETLEHLRAQHRTAAAAAVRQAWQAGGRQIQQELNQIKAEAQTIRRHFPKGLPQAAELEPVYTALDQLARYPEEDTLGEAELAAKGKALPTQEQMEELSKQYGAYRYLAAQETSPSNPRRLGGKGALAVVILLAAAGGAALVFRRPLPGGVLLGCGVLVILWAVWQSQKGRQPSGYSQERQQLARALAAGLGVSPEETALPDWDLRLETLWQETVALTQAQRTAERRLQQQAQVIAQRQQWETVVEDFFHRYQLRSFERSPSGLREVERLLHQARGLEQRYGQGRAKLAQLQREHPEEDWTGPVEPCPDLDGLTQAEAEAQRQVQSLLAQQAQATQRVLALREQAEQLPQLMDQLEEARAARDRGQKKAALLDKTIFYLEEAQRSLSQSYLDKINAGVGEYLTLLWPEAAGQRFYVNTQLEVQLERGGAVRELSYFSAGQEDLVTFCLRLALVDGLYPTEERPFLLLDDPFVNLDDENTRRAMKLLRHLGERRQIVYLTCSKSRCGI